MLDYRIAYGTGDSLTALASIAGEETRKLLVYYQRDLWLFERGARLPKGLIEL